MSDGFYHGSGTLTTFVEHTSHRRTFGWTNRGWLVTPDDNPMPRFHLFRWRR